MPYFNTENFVTIYYDELTDLFAILDSNKNTVLDFGVASEVKYAEIFAYKSFGTIKAQEICLSANQRLEDDSLIPQNSESVKSKELEVYKEPYILEYDDALAILEARYGSNFIASSKFKNGREHAVCFGLSQEQAKAINKPGRAKNYHL